MRKVIDRLFAAMDTVAKVICGVCAFGFFAVIIYQIVCRSFLGIACNWSDEVCRYLFFMMVYVGAVLCVNEHGHFSIDIATVLLPRGVQRILTFVVHAISIAFLVYLAQSGFVLCEKTAGQVSTTLGIPMPVLYMVIPVTAILMIVYTVRVAVEDGLKMHEEKTQNPERKENVG